MKAVMRVHLETQAKGNSLKGKVPKRQTSKVPNSNIVLAVYYQTCFDVAR